MRKPRNQNWSTEELSALTTNFCDMEIHEPSELTNHSVTAMRAKAKELGLERNYIRRPAEHYSERCKVDMGHDKTRQFPLSVRQALGYPEYDRRDERVIN